jgi:hypothetical protein
MEIHLNSKKEACKFVTTSFSKRGLRNNLDENQKTEKKVKGKKTIEKKGEKRKRKRTVFELCFLTAMKYSYNVNSLIKK